MLANNRNFAALGALWFGLQMLWGALLGVELQTRIDRFAGGNALLTYAFVAATGAALAALVQLAAAVLSDAQLRKVGHRRGLYGLGIGITILGVIVFFAFDSLHGLIAGFLMLELGANIAIAPYQTVISEFVQTEHFGAASAWMAGLQSLGNAVGAISATLVSNPFLLSAGIAFALLVGGAVTLRVVGQAQPIRAAPQLRSPTRDLALLFGSRALLYLGFYTLLGYTYFFVRDSLALSATQSTRAGGIVVLLFTLAGMLGAWIAGRPSDRLDRRLPAVLGGGVVSLSLLMLAGLAQTPGIAWCCASAAGVGWGGLLVADWAMASRVLPPSVRATAMATWNLAVIGPQMLAPLVATLLLANMHLTAGLLPRWAIACAAFEVLVGSLLLAGLSSRTAGYTFQERSCNGRNQIVDSCVKLR